MAGPLIDISKVWYLYPNSIAALKGVNLQVQEAEYVALMGENGSGKTTLAKHLNGLLRPTKGSVTIAGIDTRVAKTSNLSSLVGFVFQNPDHMLFCKTVEEEVAFGPKNLGMEARETADRVEKALQITGLSDVRRDSPYFFGKGTRRKITIAAVLSMNPKIFVIDEPTIGMDYKDSKEMLGLVSKLNKDGHTIIMITHDFRMVMEYATRVVVMHCGRILLDLPAKEALEHSQELLQASIRIPQITRLAMRLSSYGVQPGACDIAEVATPMISRLLGRHSV